MPPRLVTFIETVTNWYIKLNRRRLKGESGLEDTKHALNTLFDVLFTLMKALAPFMPFITDFIYQRLLPHIPKSHQGDDPRSVHFLAFPAVREELFNVEIERRVRRMQTVIDLGRVCREKCTVGTKTPLKSLVVIHADHVYLEDVKSMESYIKEELNIQELVLSSDEAKYNVQYKVSADWPVLGKKLKKEVQKVKKALPDLTSAEVFQFTIDKTIVVAGITLEEGDLVVKRSIQDDESTKNLLTNTDEDVLIILDIEIYPHLAEEGVGREIINRVNQARKQANLAVTDDVKMEYEVVEDPNDIGLTNAFTSQAAAIEKALRGPVSKYTEGVKEESVIWEKDQDIQKAIFKLRLLKM